MESLANELSDENGNSTKRCERRYQMRIHMRRKNSIKYKRQIYIVNP